MSTCLVFESAVCGGRIACPRLATLLAKDHSYNFDNKLLFLTVSVKSTPNKTVLSLKSQEYGRTSRMYSNLAVNNK